MGPTRQIFSTVVAALFACLSLACVFPFGGGGGGGGGGGPTGNCDRDPATNPSEVNTGDLRAELGKERFRNSRESLDTGTERGDAGDFSSYVFVPLDEENPTYSLVSAGGAQASTTTHISPSVLVRNPGSPDTEAVVNFQVRDPENDEVLTNTACDKGELSLWENVSEGRMFGGMRVIFSVPRSRASGTRELIADIQVGDRRKVLKRTVQLE